MGIGLVCANIHTDMTKLTVDFSKYFCDWDYKRLDVLVVTNEEQVYSLATFHLKIQVADGGSY